MNPSDRPAGLPMYDAAPPAVEAWWAGLAAWMRAEGLADVPVRPQWPRDLDAHWRDPRLLLSQTCGFPLLARYGDVLQVVGAFRYTVPGCEGIDYCSEIMVRADDPARRIEDLRGRVVACNDRESHSGWNALRALVAPLAQDGRFFGATRLSGSHRASLRLLRERQADLAAIDVVTLAGLRRHAAAELEGLRSLGRTATAPGLPLVTAAATPRAEVEALRRALARACADPALAAPREALFISAFEPAERARWQRIDVLRRAGEALRD